MNFKRYCFFVCLVALQGAFAAPGPCNTSTVVALLSQGKVLRSELVEASSQAMKAGISTQYENATLAVAQQFMSRYIERDLLHGNSSGFVASILGWDVYHEKETPE